MSNLHEYKVQLAAGVKPETPVGTESNRMGTRRTRTMAKTARACGHDFTPTTGWRSRSQIRSTKMVKSGSVKTMKKQAKETVTGDAKRM